MHYSIQQEYPWRGISSDDLARISINTLLLLSIALLAAAAWRLEVEAHGWAGLTWLEYFHWAIPAGAVAFVAWVAWAVPVKPSSKRHLALALGLAMLPLYLLAKESLVGAFAHQWYLAEPDLGYYLRRLAFIPCFISIPLLFWGAAHFWGVKINWLGRSLGALFYFGGPLLSIILLELVEHRGGADFLHAIKSGYLIPFVILGLGLPIAFAGCDVEHGKD